VVLQDLEPLVGNWRTEATMPVSGEIVAGRTSFAWLERGGYLIQRASAEDPAFPVGIMVIGPDAGGERIVQHYFDSRGVARVYDVSLEDGVLRLWRDGEDFAQRYSGRLDAEAGTITGAWERCDDGESWQHDFDLNYAKLA
jgi:hypothetical protein